MATVTKPRIRVGVDGTLRGLLPPAGRTRPGAQYMRGDSTPIFMAWNPVLRDAKDDVRAAYWRAAARAVDMLHNSGWTAGVVNKGCAAILGDGLRLALKPDFRALGWAQDTSAEWSRLIERRWELWAASPLECDTAGKASLHQQAKAALRSYFGPGEWVAWIRWIRRSCSATATKVQLIPAHRLVQETNGEDLFQGVRINAVGLPVSYRFRLARPLLETGAITEIAARDSKNRPVIAHTFDGDVGQMRGISPFAPVLQVLKQYDQLSNNTAQAANLQALFAATITSQAPTQDVLAAMEPGVDEPGVGGDYDSFMEARSGWYENTAIDLGGMSRVVHLYPSDKLEFLRSETPNSNYEPFARWLLREVAACGGFTAEDLTGDYTGATYSSIKMATTTNWPIQLWRRRHIAAPFYQAAFEAWLEEEIEASRVPFQGGIDAFHANRSAVCRGDWRGPKAPVPDELKAANASAVEYALGVTTQERMAAERGEDWEDLHEQQAREAASRRKHGLPEPVAVAHLSGNVPDSEPTVHGQQK